jgi:hypothetical protein
VYQKPRISVRCLPDFSTSYKVFVCVSVKPGEVDHIIEVIPGTVIVWEQHAIYKSNMVSRSKRVYLFLLLWNIPSIFTAKTWVK